MVAFNPDVPTRNEPNYLGLFRTPGPIGEGDQSKGIALKGAASLFKQAVEGTSDLIDAYVDYKTEEIAKEEQNTRIAELEGLASKIDANSGQPLPQPPNLSDTTTRPEDYSEVPEGALPRKAQLSEFSNNVLQGSAEPVSQDLQAAEPAMDKSLTALRQRQITRPELSLDTNARINTRLQSWRSQWGPAQAARIDRKAASILGYNPANTYANNLERFIVNAQSIRDKDYDWAMGHLGSSEYPNAEETAKAIQTPGTWESQNPRMAVIHSEAPYRAMDGRLKRKAEEIRVSNLEYDVKKRDVNATAEAEAANFAQQKWADFSRKLGQDPQNFQFKNMSSNEADAAKRLAAQYVVVTQNQIKGMLTKNPEYVKYLGSEAIDKIAANGVSFWKGVGDLYSANNPAIASIAQNHITNATHDLSWSLLQRQDTLGQWMRTAYGLSGAGVVGAQMIGMFNEIYSDPNLARDFKTWQGENQMFIHAPKSTETGGKPFSQIMEEFGAKKFGDTASRGPTAAKEVKQLYYFTDQMPKAIADPTYADKNTRRTLAMNIFTGNVASNFNEDYRDAKGNLVRGKYSIYSQMLRPETVNAVWDLAGKNPQDPVWVGMKNFASRNASILLNESARTLNDIGDVPGVKFAWDSDNSRLISAYNPPNPLILPGVTDAAPTLDTSSAKQIQERVDKFNIALQPLKQIADIQGINPNAYILAHLPKLGLEEGKVSNYGEVMKAITTPPASQFEKPGINYKAGPTLEMPPKAPEKPAGKRSSLEGTQVASAQGFAPETRTPTVEQFVSNPGSQSNLPPKYIKGVETGNIERNRFRDELEKNPKLKERILQIAAAEHNDPKAVTAVFETMFNRADVRGTNLAKQAKIYGKESGGYYPNVNPRGLNKRRDMYEAALETALAGSNISNYATDNASSWLAEKNVRLNRFEKRAAFGTGNNQETFFAPQRWGRDKYNTWLSKIEQARKQRDQGRTLLAEAE